MFPWEGKFLRWEPKLIVLKGIKAIIKCEYWDTEECPQPAEETCEGCSYQEALHDNLEECLGHSDNFSLLSLEDTPGKWSVQC